MESGTAHLVHLFAYELQVPVVCVLVYMIDLVGPVQMVVYWVSTKIKSVQSYIKLRRLSRYGTTVHVSNVATCTGVQL